MADFHVVIWFTWFLTWNWIQHITMLAKIRIEKGVATVKKLSLLLLPMLLVAGMLFTLPRTAAAQDDDPPGRVARLSYIEGAISYQASGDTDWVQANPNRPLTTGDNLWADENSRGELHIGGTAIRLGAQTGLSFLNLDDRTIQMQLAQGVIEVHLRHMVSGDAFEVDTPNLAVTLASSGEYLISTDPDSNTTVVTVREGAAEATGGGETYDLGAGHRYILNGTDQLTFDAQDENGFDDFENWCQTRDQRENNSISAHYVSRDVDGVYDLDDYGDWQNVPDYGEIWVPRGVEAGWTPYRFGNWVWIAPWGWTWVESEPWGFAPFHYGRWAFVGGYWGWVPGPVVVRPVYAPALVAFVGGGGLSVSIGFGGGFSGVAWFPLGPRDVWVPAYHCSPRYVQNVNITNSRVVNVTQVTNVYNNYTRNVTVVNNYTYAHANVAVTAVSRETFVNARPVAAASVRVTSEQLESAHVVQTTPIAPVRTSRISSEAKPAMAKPAVAFSQRPVVARLAPPTPIRNERPAAAMNEGRPMNQGAPQARPANQEQQPNRDGFKPFTPPAGQNNNPPANERPNTQNRPEQQAEQQQQRPPVRVTPAPPTKAKEEDYDVHPPLNQKPAAEPKEQNQKPAKTDAKPQKPDKPDKPHGR
jgi:hypothetical protein